MALSVALVGIVIGMFQLVLLVACGFFLAKMGALDQSGEVRFALASYYLMLPLFCFIQIAEATSVSSIIPLCYISLAFIISCIVIFILALCYCELSGADVRTKKCLIFSTAFGNVTTLPAIVVDSLCGSGGTLDRDPNCRKGFGYAMFTIFFLHIAVWSIGPLVATSDREKGRNVMRMMWVVKQFYPSAKAFLEDQELASVHEQPEENRNNPEQGQGERHESAREIFYAGGRENDSRFWENEELLAFSTEYRISRGGYRTFEAHFDSLLGKLTPDWVRKARLPPPERKIQMTAGVILSKVVAPPVVACVLGFIVGLIAPVKSALIESDIAGRVVMKTAYNVGYMAVPVSAMLLGAKLLVGFTFSKGMNLRILDIVATIVIRLVMAPVVGLGFMFLAAKLNISAVKHDRVLSFVVYANWCVPPSLVLISLFVLYDYYTRETALIQFWSNVVSVVTISAFLLLYFYLFP